MSRAPGLPAILADDAGRELLAAHGIYTDIADFLAALRPPADGGLSSLLAVSPQAPLVHIGQQVCTDYHPAVTSKFEVARTLEAHDVTPALLWHDADRAGSENFGMRILVPTAKGTRGLWLVHRSMRELELRFVPVESERLDEVFADLRAWLVHRPGGNRGDGAGRLDALADAGRARCGEHLGALNGALSEHLLREQLGLEPASTFLSIMLERGLLTEPVNAFLAVLDDVVRVFNEQLGRLGELGVDAGVKPLNEDYLPLFYSCRLCGTRLRLAREREASDHYGAAACRCGEIHRFHLGHGTPSLGELEPTGRWTPDISLPVHHNQLASGWVVGRSSALYGMVFNEVTERALGLAPIPALVPPALADGRGVDGDGPLETESLLLRYLTA